MIVTVFRSRLKPENAQEYYETAKRMSEIARSMPGYVSHKAFLAEDGERVTVVEQHAFTATATSSQEA